jgi:hypothetical protein
MKHEQIQQLADDALDAACLHMQNQLGIDDGDVAGIYFSGNVQDAIRQIFEGYIKMETAMRSRTNVRTETPA